MIAKPKVGMDGTFHLDSMEPLMDRNPWITVPYMWTSKQTEVSSSLQEPCFDSGISRL